jgi:hypothetical protein
MPVEIDYVDTLNPSIQQPALLDTVVAVPLDAVGACPTRASIVDDFGDHVGRSPDTIANKREAVERDDRDRRLKDQSSVGIQDDLRARILSASTSMASAISTSCGQGRVCRGFSTAFP